MKKILVLSEGVSDATRDNGGYVTNQETFEVDDKGFTADGTIEVDLFEKTELAQEIGEYKSFGVYYHQRPYGSGFVIDENSDIEDIIKAWQETVR